MPGLCNLSVEQQQHGARTPGTPLQRAMCAVDCGPRRMRVAGGRVACRTTASVAGLRPSDAQLFQWHPPSPDVAQARQARRIWQVGFKPRHLKRLSRHYGQVRIPKVRWVRFRWTREIPEAVKSYRVTSDRSGRWHIAFAAIPESIPGPDDGSVVGIDRGVTVSAALSTGELLYAPGLRAGETKRLRRLQQRLARARRGSHRRVRTKLAIARLRARETDRRRDWVEKTTTDVARRFATIRVEKLNVRGMTRSARGTRECPGSNSSR